MRKIIFILLLILSTISAKAQNYNNLQENLRSQISKYLISQGYNPEKQDDGLKFKYKGNTYYIEIDKDLADPMYVRLRRYIKYNEKFNNEKIKNNLNLYNKKYGVKVFCMEKSFVLSIEMFLTNSSEFNSVFDAFLSQMESTYELINE